jgi:hypothetical protein
MAQPKKPDSIKQKKLIPVRMNESIHNRLMAQSHETGVPVSARALECLVAQLERWERSRSQS